jgi:hypothetical protein
MQPVSECTVTCPGCFEAFTVTGPSPAEVPVEWDYDCEVCCRPMVIVFALDEDTVIAKAIPID